MKIKTQSKEIALTDVESSNVKAFEYDEATKDLIVAFANNTFYAYEGVEKEVADRLHAAAVDPDVSFGKVFIAEIRSKAATIPYRRLPDVQVVDVDDLEG